MRALPDAMTILLAYVGENRTALALASLTRARLAAATILFDICWNKWDQ